MFKIQLISITCTLNNEHMFMKILALKCLYTPILALKIMVKTNEKNLLVLSGKFTRFNRLKISRIPL